MPRKQKSKPAKQPDEAKPREKDPKELRPATNSRDEIRAQNAQRQGHPK